MLNRDDGTRDGVICVLLDHMDSVSSAMSRDGNNKDFMVHIYDALDATSWRVSRRQNSFDESLLNLYSKHSRELLLGLVPPASD